MAALTYTEFLVGPEKQNVLSQVLENTSRLGLEVTPFDRLDSIKLARVRAETKLRLPDAVVLQTAIERDAAIATTDSLLAKAARERGIPVYAPEG